MRKDINHKITRLNLNRIGFMGFIWKWISYFSIAVIVVSLLIFLLSIRPPRHISDITPSKLGIENYEEVEISTSDGISLSAWYIPAKNETDKTIIVCHGYPADKGDALVLSDFLHDEYNLLLFDFRGLGKSQGKFVTIGAREVEDFNSAVDYLLERGIKTIGAYGFSMGAGVILMANNPNVKAIVSNSSYARLEMILEQIYSHLGPFKLPFIFFTKLWARVFLGIDVSKVSPADAIRKSRIPLLLIHSERDSQIPIIHFNLLRKARPDAEYWIIPDADHGEVGTFWAEYKRRIKDFFARNL